MIQRLAEEVKIVQAITLTAGAAGTSAINGLAIDMSGYEAVLLVVQVGAVVAGAVTSVKVQQDTTAAFGAPADLLDSGQIVVDTADDTIFYADIRRAKEDFLRVVVSRATQAATVSAMAYLYRGRQFPTVHGAGVVGELHTSPIEGTA